jgi:hypothetical protein
LPEGSLAEHLREIAARRATKDVETASTFDLPFSIGDVVRGRASREPFVPA